VFLKKGEEALQLAGVSSGFTIYNRKIKMNEAALRVLK